MTNKFYVISKKADYTLTRLKTKSFAEEIIVKSNENILKDYLYVEQRRIIA